MRRLVIDSDGARVEAEKDWGIVTHSAGAWQLFVYGPMRHPYRIDIKRLRYVDADFKLDTMALRYLEPER